MTRSPPLLLALLLAAGCPVRPMPCNSDGDCDYPRNACDIRNAASHIVAGGEFTTAGDTGAIAQRAAQLTVAADTATGDIWLTTRSVTHQVELRRYTTSWAAPETLATSGSTLFKKDFTAGLVSLMADSLQTRARGLFSVGDSGLNADFPLLYLGTNSVLERRVVQSHPP